MYYYCFKRLVFRTRLMQFHTSRGDDQIEYTPDHEDDGWKVITLSKSNRSFREQRVIPCVQARTVSPHRVILRDFQSANSNLRTLSFTILTLLHHRNTL